MTAVPGAGQGPPANRTCHHQSDGDSVAQQGSDTERYLAGRERILGQHYRLHRDPVRAAAELAEQMGGRTFAHRWAAALLAAT